MMSESFEQRAIETSEDVDNRNCSEEYAIDCLVNLAKEADTKINDLEFELHEYREADGKECDRVNKVLADKEREIEKLNIQLNGMKTFSENYNADVIEKMLGGLWWTRAGADGVASRGQINNYIQKLRNNEQ